MNIAKIPLTTDITGLEKYTLVDLLDINSLNYTFISGDLAYENSDIRD